VVNRRHSVRRLVILPPVRVSLGDFTQELLFDLSEGGLSVYGRLTSLGRRSFPVKFSLPGDDNAITTRGEIAWTARNRTGVRFVNFPDASRFHLRHWMAAKLPPATPYPDDYKIDWAKRLLQFRRTFGEAKQVSNHWRKAALSVGILLCVVLAGRELSHFRLRLVEKAESTGKASAPPQAHLPEISDQVLAAQPTASTAGIASKVVPSDTTETPVISGSSLRRGFVVQVGALKRERNADDLSSALKQKGLPVITYRSAEDALYHVAVGPFPEASSAIQMKNQLRTQGVDGFVKPWTAE